MSRTGALRRRRQDGDGHPAEARIDGNVWAPLVHLGSVWQSHRPPTVAAATVSCWRWPRPQILGLAHAGCRAKRFIISYLQAETLYLYVK